MTDRNSPADGPCVRWGVYIVEGDQLRRPGLVGADEELVLLAVVRPAARTTVELYRGERLRDRRHIHPAPDAGETVVAVRLGRSATLTGSARLRCRLLIDGRAIGERTLLLGAPTVDGQGRLIGTPATVVSEATRLAYVRLLEDLWQPENGDV